MADILIVGADRGIGYFMVRQFLEQGGRVAVVDIRTGHIAELTQHYHDKLYVFTADEGSLSCGIKSAASALGNIDVAIHIVHFRPPVTSIIHI